MFLKQEIDTVPDLLALHQYSPDNYPFLLASNTRGELNARFSILMAFPAEWHIQENITDTDCLKNICTEFKASPDVSGLPFVGGWFVYLGYEYANSIEPSVSFFQESDSLPTAFVCRIPAAIILDHQQNSATIVANVGKEELINRIERDIAKMSAFSDHGIPDFVISEDDPDIYRSALKQVKRYIHEGDIFQANLSRNWHVDFPTACDPLALYDRLRKSNPAPFAALVKFRDRYILSSSPERLICVKTGIAETRPIAGTYPRGKTVQEDKELSQNLVQHPKERAEHVMLIDLERNDLGRICQPGTIQVQQKMIVESYEHVHHIVSSIRGELQPNTSAVDVLHAVFPGGTITGCPKVRCMQIISELEQTARGAYTGSLGYISDHGRMDMNILIRTMVLHGRQLNFRAGAGIVADSVIEKELNETRHKAKGMINALQSDY